MRTLTCKNHPNLRWSCKPEGCNPNGTYNGQRNIFFLGEQSTHPAEARPGDYTLFGACYDEAGKYVPGSGYHVQECDCPSSNLQFAPEDGGPRTPPNAAASADL